MKKIMAGLGLVVLGLAAVVLLRTLSHNPGENKAVELSQEGLNAELIAEHLSEAIQIQTISHSVEREPGPEFEQFLTWLQERYPQVFSSLSLERVNQYSLLLKWQGSEQSLAPVLLSAHYDVVPIIPNTESLWEHEPFSGDISDGYIWGRGALDDKSAVVALFEAATLLISEGHKPQQTIYLSITHDEELGSPKGAKAITDLLLSRDERLDWTLDEGSFVLDNFIPGMPIPVASINVAEKGFMTVELSVRGKGGHSSIPPAQTTVGILSAAISKLQDNQIAGGLEGVSAEMFDVLSRYMPFGKKLFFANRWLFDGALNTELSKVPFSNALLRTTTAPTMLSAGVKDNVLPIDAMGTVNFRLHPRDTPESVLAHIESVVDDERVKVTTRIAHPASPVADYESDAFNLIAQVSLDSFGELIVAPSITVGGTDSAQYQRAAGNSYRFNPMMIGPDDLAGFHGTNERISIENMSKAVTFYRHLIRSMAVTASE